MHSIFKILSQRTAALHLHKDVTCILFSSAEQCSGFKWLYWGYIDGLMPHCSIASASAKEILQYLTEPSIYRLWYMSLYELYCILFCQKTHRRGLQASSRDTIPYFIWPANLWKIICDFISLRLPAYSSSPNMWWIACSAVFVRHSAILTYWLSITSNLCFTSLIVTHHVLLTLSMYSVYSRVVATDIYLIWFDIKETINGKTKYLYSSWMLYQPQKKKYWQLISFSRYGYRVRCNTGTFSTSWVIYIVTPDYTARNFMSHSVLSW